MIQCLPGTSSGPHSQPLEAPALSQNCSTGLSWLPKPQGLLTCYFISTLSTDEETKAQRG